MPDFTPEATYWIKEVQRREYALEAARELDAPADEVARLQAEVDEADRQRKEHLGR